jgi:O-antigen/teichoic acid export membrane protein
MGRYSTRGVVPKLKTRAGMVCSLVGIRPGLIHPKVMSGSLMLLIGSALVSLLNLIYNVGVARLLGPVAFGEAAVVYTLLMLMSAVTLSFQLVVAKFVAKNNDLSAKAAVYHRLSRQAWHFGIPSAAVLILASGPIAHFLNIRSSSLIVLLGIGILFYVPLGVRRGGMQGLLSFRKLALNYVLEGVVKLCGAFLMIRLGLGVVGAVGAMAASVILAFAFGNPGSELNAESQTTVTVSFREGMQAIVFFIGQVVINNVDIVLVKHFFTPVQAGLYAAAALVGRVVYMSSWSVVSAMFPISAGNERADEEHSVLLTPLLVVLLITGSFTLLLWLFPKLVWNAVFGATFKQAVTNYFSSLLPLYAAATGIYCLSVVLIAYEMSRKIANTGWLQLGFSGGIVLGITLFHSTLQMVVIVQLVELSVLLLAVSIPFVRRRRENKASGTRGITAMQRVQKLTENEVISEFLKAEFHRPQFDHDRGRFEDLVHKPNFANEQENAIRRALLFRVRGPLWRELPDDTEWWEVQFSAEDLERIQFFPRANWLRLSRGRGFYVHSIVARLRNATPDHLPEKFLNKIANLRSSLLEERERSAIVLIGVNEHRDLTILEGNHRMAAAMLVSPSILEQRFRFLCGFSPHMVRCCWYQTNLSTLWRYFRHKLKAETDLDIDLRLITETQAGTPVET